MKTLARWHRLLGVAALALVAPALDGCGGSSSSASSATRTKGTSAELVARSFDGASGPVQIKTLSNRADLIGGGDAFVELVLPLPAVPDSLRVALNGKDVTDAFAVRASGRILGLLTGLVDGENVVTASIGSSHAGKLVITNHPIGGPVIAGPQTQPFVCATPVAQPATATTPATNASGLSTFAIDAQCNIATETHFFYRTTTPGCSSALPDPVGPPPANNCFKPFTFTPGQPMPADLATTTTDQGVTVPYIVRVERGTIDRGIYDVAVLFDPSQDWKPWAPQPAWNGKLVYTFGASTGQPRRQFRSEQNWADDAALSRGFMVADNSMTDSLFNSNRVYDAEALMMMKEHIIETYGEIRYTIGNGCSGGSIQQNTAASIFPELLDGIQPTCTYPDSETTSIEVADCVLLVNYFDSLAFKTLVMGLTQAQINAKKAAIAGHVDQTGCFAWNNSFGTNSKPGQFVPVLVVNATTGALAPVPPARNNCQLPSFQVYDPVTNPNGPRCGGADNAISIFGPTPGTTNRGRTTGDNVGVQYGLQALASGAITAEEFVTLNENIGGVDGDSNPSIHRTVADPDALSIAYAAGIVSEGQLARTPIIDLRGWDDSAIGGLGIHHIWRSFSLRERLDKANGNHANHVMWRYGTGLIAPAASGLTLQSFLTMDQWLANIEADHGDLPRAEKVAANKPAGAFDFCYLTSDTTFSTKVTDFAVCDTDPRLRRHASPRQVAGGPLSEDVLKCQLKPLDPADPAYGGASFTDAQFARLNAVFPDGVCDWTKPGVNQVPFAGPRTFQDGPGGKPLGPPPASTPL
jgi:Tannase-like family of unknown function (DUF6351)